MFSVLCSDECLFDMLSSYVENQYVSQTMVSHPKTRRSTSSKKIHAPCMRRVFEDVLPGKKDIKALNLKSYTFMGNLTQRKVGFFDENGGKLSYKYAGKKHSAAPFTPWLQKLAKKLRERIPSADFNCANINLYPLGTNGSLSRHLDDEPCHASDTIFSVSFGASNKMHFYDDKKGKAIKSVTINHGDLVVFDRMTWHSIGSSKHVKNVNYRLNVTFRKFFENDNEKHPYEISRLSVSTKKCLSMP